MGNHLDRSKYYGFRYFIFPLLLAMAVALPASAAEDSAAESGRSKAVELGVSIEAVRARIADLESLENQNSETKSALDLYRAALTHLQKAQENNKLTIEYKQVVDELSLRQAKLQDELKQKQAALEQQQDTKLNLDQDELKLQLDQAIASNTLDRNRLAELESELRRERLRPDQSSAELQEVKRQLSAIDRKLPQIEDTKSAISDAQYISIVTNKQEITSRIQLLEMERLSHAPRITLLNMRIDLMRSQLKLSAQRMDLLQGELNRVLAEEARKIQRATEKARRGATGKHPVVGREAEYNSGLGDRLGDLTKTIERLITQKAELNTLLKRISQNRERAQQQVDIVGLDEPLGEFLLAQNRTLPDRRRLDLKAYEYRREMALVRVQQFRLADELQGIAEEEAAAAFIRALQPKDLQSRDVAGFNQAITELLVDRIELLNKLAAEHHRYESVLNDLSLEQQELSSEVAAFQEFLNRVLVWIPSTSQFGVVDLQQLQEALGWLVSAGNWQTVVTKLGDSAEKFPIRTAIVLIAVMALLLMRRRMFGYLERVAPRIGKVNFDRYRYSLAALLITLMLALPPVLILAGIGWLSYKDESPGFPWAVGIAAMSAAALMLILRIGRYLMMPNGLARIHLRWDPHAVDVYARTLPWLTPIFVIAGFIAGITEWELEEGYWNSLGRVASIITTLIMLWFAHISLNPKRGALSRSRHVIVQGLRLKMLWYPLALVLGLVLLVLTFEGYHYTAVVLKRLLFASFCVGVLVLLLQSFARRWLLVAQRRIALKRARARRQAAEDAKAAKEAAEAAGEGVPESEDLDEINLATVSGQTQRMLRLFAVVAFFLVTFLIWSQLTPALSGLDEIVLWQHQPSGVAGAALVAVSLLDLLFSALVLLLMLAAVRNLPGLLEMAILQPLALEPGNRYAVTSISRYLIFGIGFFAALSLLGIGWNDVQWLVAAMGVGLGFGLKEIFANFFSGLIILFERPIRIGDTVTIGDLSGTVTRIRIRATTVTDWDNKEQVIPNQNFLINPLINWTLSDPVTRVVFSVGIAYGSDTEKALQVMTDVVQGHPEVLDEPRPTVFFIGFGESSLDFEVRVFVRERLRRIPLRHDLHMGLNQALAEAGIEIPFPQRDLHLRSVAPGLELDANGPESA